MKKTITGLMLLILAGEVTARNAVAEEPNNIGEMLRAKGVEWLIGNWETTSERGEKVEAKFSLDTDGYIINVEGNVGPSKGRGIIFCVPIKKTLIYRGADNQGGNMAGTCQIEDGKFVMDLEAMTADGKITKFTRYLSKTDTDTMKCETFVLKDGKKPEQPTGIFEFKREK